MGLLYRGLRPSEDSADSKVGLLPVEKATAEEIIDGFPLSQTVIGSTIATRKSLYVTASANGQNNSLLALLPPPNDQKTGYSDTGPGSYYRTQDALRIGSLNCAINTPDATSLVGTTYTTDGTDTDIGKILKPAIATTDTSGLIPLAQLPSMGAGYMLGPYGYTDPGQTGGTTATGTFKLAQWIITQPGIGFFQPMVFMVVQAKSEFLGRPLIEVRISAAAPSAYSTSHPLVATGIGRSFRHKLFSADYLGNTSPNNIQTVTVMPCSAISGQTFSGTTSFDASYGTGTTPKVFYLTAWMKEAGVNGVGVSSSYSIVSGSAFLMKMST